MGCSGSIKKRPNYKSCVRYYNNTVQPLTENETTQLVIAGSRVADTGVSIDTQPSAYTILTKGLYHISADIVFNVTTAATVGTSTIAAYMDGVILPCTHTITRLPVGYTAVHLETDLDIESCCCNVNKTITFGITLNDTVVAEVTHICTGIIKEA